jgi:hypothetical protein
MSDTGAENIELTDDELREALGVLFDGSKRTPEQTQKAKDRLKATLQMQARPQVVMNRIIESPGEIKKTG